MFKTVHKFSVKWRKSKKGYWKRQLSSTDTNKASCNSSLILKTVTRFLLNQENSGKVIGNDSFNQQKYKQFEFQEKRITLAQHSVMKLNYFWIIFLISMSQLPFLPHFEIVNRYSFLSCVNVWFTRPTTLGNADQTPDASYNCLKRRLGTSEVTDGNQTL